MTPKILLFDEPTSAPDPKMVKEVLNTMISLVREGRWTRNIGEDMFGRDVHGKTLGILGFGRIGQAVARRPELWHAGA